MANIVRRRFGVASVLLAFIGLTACGGFGDPDTKLRGPGRHVGEVHVLRVADPAPRTMGAGGASPATRFVPLRRALDVEGQDGPAYIVEADDSIMVSLNYGFIRYFRETGQASRKGELLLVVSFDSSDPAGQTPATGTEKNSIVVYAADNQTLGSSLGVKDWPMFGPVKVPHGELFMRVVIIENDSVENKRVGSTIKSVVGAATTFRPDLAVASVITGAVADMVVRLNSDDVVFDTRFALRRATPGQEYYRGPLLYGRYALILQEDRLLGTDVSAVAPGAAFVPQFHRLRYDRNSGMIYSAYNYYPISDPLLDILGDKEKAKTDKDCVAADPLMPTYRGRFIEGRGPVDWRTLPYWALDQNPQLKAHRDLLIEGGPQYRRCLLNWVNGKQAREFRRDNLGYPNDGNIADHDLISHFDAALVRAYYAMHRTPLPPEREQEALRKFIAQGNQQLDFNVVHYPEAFTAMAQFAQHTHLIFSIEPAVSPDGPRVHDRLPQYEAMLKELMDKAGQPTAIAALAAEIESAYKERLALRQALQKSGEAAGRSDTTQAQVCPLYRQLVSYGAGPLKNMQGYGADALQREIKRRTGRTFANATEVGDWLGQQNCGTLTAGDCGCAASTPPAAAPAPPAIVPEVAPEAMSTSRQ